MPSLKKLNKNFSCKICKAGNVIQNGGQNHGNNVETIEKSSRPRLNWRRLETDPSTVSKNGLFPFSQSLMSIIISNSLNAASLREKVYRLSV